ncbi:DAK2 domain-containing protein [Streptomyces odontomachi]|uniref:DAK2 domain-containing protein n=1 Tax=Streptomyces odontomachi TaxID=2944940 RepID=UPI0021087E8A|nr:DAK2 domain-containing protein [Streptomyces sp. ODS25]
MEPEQSGRPPQGTAAGRRPVLDAAAVRTWCALALDALGRAREDIDAINVYPVADGDTGTNLYLTLESAAGAVDASFAGLAPGLPTLAEATRAMAHGALIGARGNSGTILAQLLRGLAQVLAAEGDAAGPGVVDGVGGAGGADGRALRTALRRAAESAYEAVAHPVEGTVLTVASAAATAAEDTGDDECGAVARAAYQGACEALEATPGQLAVLDREGVVDAGGQGLVVLLAALAETLTGEALTKAARGRSLGARTARPEPPAHPIASPTTPDGEQPDKDAGCADTDMAADGPAYEVIYLLEAGEAAVDRLRARLDGLGDSLVVGGGDGLWSIHVHVDDAGAAVEAGVEAGRPHRIRITHFGAGSAHAAPAGTAGRPHERAQRAVVAVVPGEGLGALCAAAGATTLLARPGEPPASGELAAAIRRAHAHEVVLLLNDDTLRHAAAAAAEQVRTAGIRVAVIPTRAAVQGLAALAVHAPDRRFDEDVVTMTTAAGATRHAELTVAERRSWTSAGICQAGDVLGLIDGDVAVIGSDPAAAGAAVLDRMLSAGGELVTLITSDTTPDALVPHLEDHVRRSHLAVDTVTYAGGQRVPLLLIGVE